MWHRCWWAMPSFASVKSTNRWAFAVLEAPHRPTEDAAFERLYHLSMIAKEMRYAEYVGAIAGRD